LTTNQENLKQLQKLAVYT